MGSEMVDNGEGEKGRKCLMVRADKGGFLDMLIFMLSGCRLHEFLDGSPSSVAAADSCLSSCGHRWVIVVTIVIRKAISFFRKPLAWSGMLMEFLLNLFAQNGGFIDLFLNLVTGKVVIPQRDSDEFLSVIGHLDPRVDLYNGNSCLTATNNKGYGNTTIRSRSLVDLCIMASKLAYENEKFVKRIVEKNWKMHFVEFFNCWNENQKRRSTQVFIICDKSADANLILISFRGTEPFDSDDWITDLDYSCYEIPKLGKVHMGFLEALGLGYRKQPSSFCFHSAAKHQSSSLSFATKMNEDDFSAYYSVRTKLKSLLNEHKSAKFLVTGHSLGGALAILFPVVLKFHEEDVLLQRLLAVYTFGQPRVGDEQLGKYMESCVCYPVPRYFRVVYSYDLVPRLPYDDKTFFYKHFGICLYYSSLYVEKDMKEEPNKNYFGLRCVLQAHLNAVWELFRAVTMAYLYGAEYKEGWFPITFRVLGLSIPGISAHCPSNYVNSVRLGKAVGRNHAL